MNNIVLSDEDILAIKKEIVLGTPNYDSGHLYEFRLYSKEYGDLFCHVKYSKNYNYTIGIRYTDGNKIVKENHEIYFPEDDEFRDTNEYKQLKVINFITKHKNKLAINLQGKSQGVVVPISFSFIENLIKSYDCFVNEFTFEEINGYYVMIQKDIFGEDMSNFIDEDYYNMI